MLYVENVIHVGCCPHPLEPLNLRHCVSPHAFTAADAAAVAAAAVAAVAVVAVVAVVAFPVSEHNARALARVIPSKP